MITINNDTYRNLQEQVLENKQKIAQFEAVERVLANFGIFIVGRANSWTDLPGGNDTYPLPAAPDYDGNFGDAYAVGASEPYNYWIYTRADANAGYTTPYWLNVGPLAIVGPQGPQGEKGDDGADGKRGSLWYFGPNVPSGGTYQQYDKYINTSNGTLYNYSGGGWTQIGTLRGPQGIQGIQGPQGLTGPQGPQGPQGVKGDAGQSFHVEGVLDNTNQLPTPTQAIRAGAYLIENTETGDWDVYMIIGGHNPGDTLEWFNAGNVTSITGPQGPQGPQGEIGPQGPTGPQGTSFVNATRGTVTSTLEYTTTNVNFIKDNGQSVTIGIQAQRGPQGPTGATGPRGLQGLTGPTGAQGPQGVQGIQGKTGPTGATGPQGVSVTNISAGQSSIVGNQTITPITFSKDNGDSIQLGVYAQNGVTPDLTPYYTKTEVNEIISNLKQFHAEIVDSLPDVGDPAIIYFVPIAGQADAYDEYMWINGTWEKVGATRVDLSAYMLKADGVKDISSILIDSANTLTIEDDYVQYTPQINTIHGDNSVSGGNHPVQIPLVSSNSITRNNVDNKIVLELASSIQDQINGALPADNVPNINQAIATDRIDTTNFSAEIKNNNVEFYTYVNTADGQQSPFYLDLSLADSDNIVRTIIPPASDGDGGWGDKIAYDLSDALKQSLSDTQTTAEDAQTKANENASDIIDLGVEIDLLKNTKQDKLTSGRTVATINGESILNTSTATDAKNFHLMYASGADYSGSTIDLGELPQYPDYSYTYVKSYPDLITAINTSTFSRKSTEDQVTIYNLVTGSNVESNNQLPKTECFFTGTHTHQGAFNPQPNYQYQIRVYSGPTNPNIAGTIYPSGVMFCEVFGSPRTEDDFVGEVVFDEIEQLNSALEATNANISTVQESVTELSNNVSETMKNIVSQTMQAKSWGYNTGIITTVTDTVTRQDGSQASYSYETALPIDASNGILKSVNNNRAQFALTSDIFKYVRDCSNLDIYDKTFYLEGGDEVSIDLSSAVSNLSGGLSNSYVILDIRMDVSDDQGGTTYTFYDQLTIPSIQSTLPDWPYHASCTQYVRDKRYTLEIRMPDISQTWARITVDGDTVTSLVGNVASFKILRATRITPQ